MTRRVSYQAFLPQLPEAAPAPPAVRWTRAKDARRRVSIALSKDQVTWLTTAAAGTSADDVVRALVDVAMSQTTDLGSATTRRELRARVAATLGTARG